MADYQAIAQALRSHFVTEWNALSNGYPTSSHLCPENDFDWPEPKDANGKPLPWFRLTVEVAASDQATFGAPTAGKYDWIGSLVVEFFAPVDTGTGTLESLIADAIPILRGQKTSGIHISNPYPVKLGIVEDQYFKMNLIADWQHFEVAA